MAEEYGSETGFIRKTETPDSARRESNPKKARYTGESLASLRENIRKGRIDAKIKKYNEEFEKLKNLAAEINESRDVAEKTAEGEAKADAYSDVMSGIEKYNAQAKKLAKLGVSILAFDEDVRKITMANDASVKAIRVPGFLIGPLKMLTKAGREKARLEKEAKVEKQALEQQMYDAIVATAQDAVGQEVDDSINVEKFASLENIAGAKEVALGAIAEPTVDVAVVEEEKTDVVESPDANVEKKKNVVSSAIAEAARKDRKAAAVDENAREIREAFEKINNSENELKALEETTRAKGVIYFNVTKSGEEYLLCANRPNMRPLTFDKEVFANVISVESQEEVDRLYSEFTDLLLFRDAWAKAANKEYRESSLPGALNGYFGQYDDDRAELFSYVVTAIRAGKTREELLDGMPKTFSEDEHKIIETFTTDYELVQRGVHALDDFVAAKTTYVEKVDEEVVEEELDENLFNFLKKGRESFGVGLIKSGDKNVYILVSHKDGMEDETITPSDFAKMFNIPEDVNVNELYSGFVKTMYLASIWEKVASKENNTGAYDEDREKVFNFIVNSVRDGKTKEEIKASIGADFTEDEVRIINTMVDSHYNVVKGAVEVYYGKEEELVTDSVDKKKKVVNDTISALAKAKYGSKTNDDDEIVVEDDEKDELVVNPLEEEDKKDLDAEVVTEEEGYIAQLKKLSEEISELTKIKNQLESSLGSDVINAKLAELQKLIDEKIAKINEITVGNITDLKKKTTAEGMETELTDTGKTKVLGVTDAEVVDGKNSNPVVDDKDDVVLNPEEQKKKSEIGETPVEMFPYSVPKTEEEIQDEIAWWTKVAPILDDPAQQELSRLNLLAREREEVARRAEDEIERRHFEERRAALIDKVHADTEEKYRSMADRKREILDANGHEDVEDVSFLDDVREMNPELYRKMFNQYKETKLGRKTTTTPDDSKFFDVAFSDEVADAEDEFVEIDFGGDVAVVDESPVAKKNDVDAQPEFHEVDFGYPKPLTEEEIQDNVAWWNGVVGIMDDPGQQELTRINLLAREREEVARRAEDEVERSRFEERRAKFVEGVHERNAALQERVASRKRAILDAYGLTDVEDETFLDDVKAGNPELYDKMYKNYLEVRREELKELARSSSNDNSEGARKK